MTIQESIKAADERLNKKRGYPANDISFIFERLNQNGLIEVGWRESCGKTHITQEIYREWVKVVKIMRKSGIAVQEERVKHKCAYATNAGGFWNSIIYTIKTFPT